MEKNNSILNKLKFIIKICIVAYLLKARTVEPAVFSVRAVLRPYNEERLPVRDNLETEVRTVGA
jgi:hypothetical protein